MSWPNRGGARPRRWRSLGAAVLLGVLASLGSALIVTAHTSLFESNPPDGAELQEAPSQIRLLFTTDVSAELSEVLLTDGDGREQLLGNARHEGPREIVVDVPPLGRGVYHVRWRVAAPSDLHELSGSIVFGVGLAPPPSTSRPTPPFQPLPLSVARFMELLGFASVLGAAVVGRLVLGPQAQSTARRRLTWLAIAGSAVAVLAGGARMLIVAGGLPGGGRLAAAPSLIPTWLGASATMITLAAITGLALRARSTRSPTHRLGDVATIALTVGSAALLVQGTHLAIAGPLGTANAAVHLLGGGVWVGGMTALGLVLGAPALPGETGRVPVRWAIQRFGLIALPAALVVAGSGLVAAGVVLPRPGEVAGSFIALLAAKVGFALAMAVMGLRNAMSVSGPARRLGARGSAALRAWLDLATGRRRVSGPSATWMSSEIAAAVVVIAFGALLSGASAEAPNRALAVPAASATARADDLVVALTVRPARPGRNFLSVAVLDTRRPSLGPVKELDLLVSDGVGAARSVQAQQTLGQWVAVIDLPARGRWSADVVLRRDGLADARANLGWDLPPAPGGPEERPLRLPATIAGIAAVAIGIAIVLVAIAGPGRRRQGAVGRVLSQPATGS